ncbi:MAG: hypothetical protein LBQ12_15965, partial [Deltaproteobacteria bacterium]|nr:hypothetical protein [Deltaproteobacteria bacterium]
MRNSILAKLSCLLGLAALVMAASPLVAQTPPNPFEGQPELTAADIPAAVEFIQITMANPGDPAAMLAAYEKYNIDPARGAYLATKCMTGI